MKNQFQVCKPLQGRGMPGMPTGSSQGSGERAGRGAMAGGSPLQGGHCLLVGQKWAGEPRGALAWSRRCCRLGTGSLRGLPRPDPCPSHSMFQPGSLPGAAAGPASSCQTMCESVGTRSSSAGRKPPILASRPSGHAVTPREPRCECARLPPAARAPRPLREL